MLIASLVIVSAMYAPVVLLPPSGEVKLKYEDIVAMLGQKPVSTEVKAVVRVIGLRPTITYGYWEGSRTVKSEQFYLIWSQKGLGLSVDDERIRAIWLYNQGAEDHERYPGELPGGITFDDTTADVERKIGSPNDIKEAPYKHKSGLMEQMRIADYQYKGINFTIEYRWAQGTNRPRIYSIGLHAVEPE